MHRAHVDDAAAALLVHVAQGCARGQEGAVEVDGQQPLPIVERQLLDRRDDLNAGIADQNIDSPEFLDDLAMAASTCASLVTSTVTAIALAPSSLSSAATRRAGGTIQIGRGHSSRRRGRKYGRSLSPMPLAAPVTTATLWQQAHFRTLCPPASLPFRSLFCTGL